MKRNQTGKGPKGAVLETKGTPTPPDPVLARLDALEERVYALESAKVDEIVAKVTERKQNEAIADALDDNRQALMRAERSDEPDAIYDGPIEVVGGGTEALIASGRGTCNQATYNGIKQELERMGKTEFGCQMGVRFFAIELIVDPFAQDGKIMPVVRT